VQWFDEERPVAVDTRTGTRGHVMGKLGGQTYLRPLHGGPEWAVPSDRVQLDTKEPEETT
jgi:hypothetical protein